MRRSHEPHICTCVCCRGTRWGRVVHCSQLQGGQRQQKPGTKWWLIAAAGVAVIIGVGTFLATRAPDQTQVAISEPVTLKTTWAVPLFDGPSQTGWVAQKPGTQWKVIPDPVERAYALAVKAREKSEGSIRKRISGLSTASPLFEVEFNLLLHTATAAGLQFGMAETSSSYRLRVTRDDIPLLNESGDELHKTDSPPEVTKTL